MPEAEGIAAMIAASYTPDKVIEMVADAAADEEPEVVDHRLRETGNGPTVSYEEALLREYFGEPDEEGVYR